MGRTPSPMTQPDKGRARAKSPKTNGNRVEKNRYVQKKNKLGERLQDITVDEFVNFFHLRLENVTVRIGSEQTPYSLPRSLLCQKSLSLRSMFLGGFDTKNDNDEIRIKDAPKDAFEAIIQNMYTDKITLPDYETQYKPSKAITKYLDIIKLTSRLQLTTDFLARNAATAVWGLLRKNPSEIRDRHLKMVFHHTYWLEGWAFDNVRKEFVKEMAEEWFDATIGANSGKMLKYDLEGIMTRDAEIARMVLVAVGQMLKKRAAWSGIHPLTGKALAAKEVNGDAVQDEGNEGDQDYEGEGIDEFEEEEVDEFEHEVDADDEKFEGFSDSEVSSSLDHTVSEGGRFWEVSNKL